MNCVRVEPHAKTSREMTLVINSQLRPLNFRGTAKSHEKPSYEYAVSDDGPKLKVYSTRKTARDVDA